MAFFSVISFASSILELSILSHTLAHLENFWSTLALDKGRKRKEKKAKGNKDQDRNGWNKWLQLDYLHVLSCTYDFVTSLDIRSACMCVFSSLAIIDMDFFRCDSGFRLAFPFLDNHNVMESSL